MFSLVVALTQLQAKFGTASRLFSLHLFIMLNFWEPCYAVKGTRTHRKLAVLGIFVTAVMGTCRNLAGKALGGSLPSDSSIYAPLSSTLVLLELSNNGLCGNVPSALDQLTALQTLELHDNQFSGPLPDLNGLMQMTVVNFASNQLTGDSVGHSSACQGVRLLIQVCTAAVALQRPVVMHSALQLC